MDVSPRTGPAAAPGAADSGLDLVPRPPRPPRSRGRGVLSGLVIAGLLAATGFVVIRQLQGAALYYYNADEAVAQRAEIGDARIRVQGTVVGEPVEVDDETTTFTIAFRGASIDIRHTGVEPALFDVDVPAVVEGRFAADGVFHSTRIVVKHTEQYKQDHTDRVEPGAP